jgi:hydrogenase expression/formation protein HypE
LVGKVVTMAHGGGGSRMLELLEKVVFPAFGEPILAAAEDAAALSLPGERVAYTTDSFVVKPIFFPGGDIGKLAVCGTVNDLAMRGARPLYLTMGLILEEGLEFAVLERILASVVLWSREAGVKVVAGDTKVVEKGAADAI